MRIAFIIAGTGSTYCGSCLRDHCYARQLIALGDDVVLVPAYLPPRFEHDTPRPEPTVVLGGVSIYLLASFPWARQLPALLLRSLDQPWLLTLLGRGGHATDAARLGPLAVEMLKGPHGAAAPEFERAADLISRRIAPDVVILPNLMLSSLAPMLRTRGIRTVVIAAGEAAFISQLGEQPARAVWHWIAHWLPETDAVVSYSRYYARYLQQRLGRPVPIALLPLPVDCPPEPSQPTGRGHTVRVLFFSRLVPEKGLDLLVEALGRLRREQPGLPFRLEIAGSGASARDGFLRTVRARADELLGREQWHYYGELTGTEKWQRLYEADLWVLPSRTDDSQNLAALEAMAAGTAIVVPARGWYPELVENTRGGVLYRPDDQAALTDAIARLVADHALRHTLGRQAMVQVRAQHAAEIATRALRQLLARVAGKSPEPAAAEPEQPHDRPTAQADP